MTGWAKALPALLALSACSATRHLPAENALGPYAGSVLSGDFCFVSGKIGDRDGTFAHEVRTAITAVETELARSGLDLAQVVLVTVYLTDMSNYATLNDIYTSRFSDPFPARVVVEVRALPGNARLEIQATARRSP